MATPLIHPHTTVTPFSSLRTLFIPPGATFLTPYKREGNLIWPTLLDNVTPSMRIAWEEPFGPVVPIIRVDGPEQAVEHCNKSKFGLQVGVRVTMCVC